MTLLSAAKSFLRPYRRPLFEAIGSDRYSYLGLDGLDKKLKKHLDFRGGVFIEAGANDGLTQSNTYWFEKFRGWRGLLVEAVPDAAAECRRNRPGATVVNAALVANDETKSIKVAAGGLRGYVTGHFSDQAHEEYHRQVAAEYLGQRMLRDIEVPARTISSILDEMGTSRVDLFSLDVEGYELDVLRGLDVRRHTPTYLLVETSRPAEVLEVLGGRYEIADRPTEGDFLFRLKDEGKQA